MTHIPAPKNAQSMSRTNITVVLPSATLIPQTNALSFFWGGTGFRRAGAAAGVAGVATVVGVWAAGGFADAPVGAGL